MCKTIKTSISLDFIFIFFFKQLLISGFFSDFKEVCLGSGWLKICVLFVNVMQASLFMKKQDIEFFDNERICWIWTYFGEKSFLGTKVWEFFDYATVVNLKLLPFKQDNCYLKKRNYVCNVY